MISDSITRKCPTTSGVSCSSSLILPSKDSKLRSVEQQAFEFGAYPETYLITEPNYEHFWMKDGNGLVGYFLDGRYIHIIGGLITEDRFKPELLRQFLKFARERKYHINFFAIPIEELPLFENEHFQITQFGENTWLPLENHSWSGKDYSWIRRQVSYVRRHGIDFKELRLADLTAEERAKLFETLFEINQEHLKHRVLSHDIFLMEGRLHEDYFFRRRLFLAYERAEPHRWEAFVACTPMQGGRAWATEMYRNRCNRTRGVVPFLLASTIDQFQSEGVDAVSLCMIPAYNCQAYPGESRTTRSLFHLWEKRLNFVFNVQGLAHFKSRFRPQFEPVYLCVSPRITAGSTLSFLRCGGFMKMNVLNLLKLPFSRSS